MPTPSKRVPFRLVLDVGTTTLKALAFNDADEVLSRATFHLSKAHPRRGWTEQDPRVFVKRSIEVLRRACSGADLDPKRCLGLGVTNQRETTIVWNVKTGRAVYPAIVWEDRRTAAWCSRRLEWNEDIHAATGLALEPYFSASKLRWILEHAPIGDASRLAFGTVDTWLLWNLCEGHPHLTDETNASRTLLFDIRRRAWSPDLLGRFGVSAALLPFVQPSRSLFGRLHPDILGFPIPVRAVCGDQQSSLFAALSTYPHFSRMTKVTYGTGTFIMQTLGARFRSLSHLYTTIVPGVGGDALYACEAKIERGGVQAEPFLKDPVALRRFLVDLAKRVDRAFDELPVRPKDIVIDGGLTRDGLLAEIQGEISNVKVHPLPTYDGTALGVARMIVP